MFALQLKLIAASCGKERENDAGEVVGENDSMQLVRMRAREGERRRAHMFLSMMRREILILRARRSGRGRSLLLYLRQRPRYATAIARCCSHDARFK